MAIALVSHFTEGNVNGFTSAAFNSSGGNFVMVAVSENSAGGVTGITDSKGNTYTPLTEGNFQPQGRLFYAKNATCGAGHTVTEAGNTFANICVAAFSGVDTTAPFDAEDGQAGAFGSTAQSLGAITPAVNGELIIAMMSFNNGGTLTIDSGMTILDQAPTGSSWGCGMAYLLQGTAGAINPTWTNGGGAMNGAIRIACFKAASGGGGVTVKPLAALGVG